MAYGWEGELVRLVPIDLEKHWENAVAWMNDPDVTKYLLAGDLPVTRLAEKDWFERSSRPNDEDIVFAIELLDGEHIGFTGLHRISWQNRTAVSGTLIGSKSHWGQGLGTDAAKVRLRYAFEVLGLRMVMSDVMAQNHPSIKMLTKAGYIECGRIPKKIWKRGAYQDELVMYIDIDRWLSLNPQAE